MTAAPALLLSAQTAAPGVIFIAAVLIRMILKNRKEISDI